MAFVGTVLWVSPAKCRQLIFMESLWKSVRWHVVSTLPRLQAVVCTSRWKTNVSRGGVHQRMVVSAVVVQRSRKFNLLRDAAQRVVLSSLSQHACLVPRHGHMSCQAHLNDSIICMCCSVIRVSVCTHPPPQLTPVCSCSPASTKLQSCC